MIKSTINTILNVKIRKKLQSAPAKIKKIKKLFEIILSVCERFHVYAIFHVFAIHHHSKCIQYLKDIHPKQRICNDCENNYKCEAGSKNITTG